MNQTGDEHFPTDFERNLEFLLSASPAVLYSRGVTGAFLLHFVSANVCRILGFTEDLFLTTPSFFYSHIHPDDVHEVREGIRTAAESGYGKLEYRFLHADGAYRWLHDEMTLVCSPTGAKCELVGSLLDVTDRKEAENELMVAWQQQREQEQIFRNSPAMAFLWRADEDWTVEYVSDNISQFGYAPQDFFMAALTYADMVHPEDLTVVRKVADDLEKSGRNTFQLEYRILTKDGDVRWVDERSRLFRDEDGVPTHYQGVLLDITERKTAETSLRASEERYHRLFETSSDAILLYDKKGRIIDVNPSAEHLIGRSCEWLREQNIISLTVPEERARSRDLMETVARKGRVRSEITMQRPDGKRIALEVSGSVIDREAGMYQVVARDMTERNRLENSLREARDELEVRVRERTGQLAEANKALVEAVERAEAAADSKSQFLANMSHEIRTPLNGIMGATELLLQGSPTEEQRQFLEMMQRSSNALLLLINDILDFSRIEAGKLALQKIPFCLTTLIDDVATLLMPRVREKGIDLFVRYSPGLPSLFVGDPSRLRQVMVNLVGNAVKFTDEGHVYVNVEHTLLESQQVQLRIEVQDTGIGIPQDKVAEIFQLFTQVHDISVGERGGTGLGLAISSRLLSMMGGELSVESEQGKGATLQVSLVLPAQVTLAEKPSLALPPESTLTCVLLCANPLHRLILLELFSVARIPCTPSAEDGEAVAAVQAKVDRGNETVVLFVVHHPPEVDAFALLRMLGNSPVFSHLRVVVVMDIALQKDVELLRALGASGYLLKPIRHVPLEKMLQTLFAGGKEAFITPASLSAVPSVPLEKKQPLGTLRAARVLLVEDNEVNRKIAMAMLSKLGCTVKQACNGKEALDLVGEEPYDLIFMDCRMPEVDGYEATRRIREMEKPGERVPIIALTAGVVAGTREACLAAGMDDYLSKPIQLDALEQKISRWYEGETACHLWNAPRILIVEDEPNMRSMLVRMVYNMYPDAIVRDVPGGVEACAIMQSFEPALILMDMRMPDMDGEGVLRFMRKDAELSSIQVIIYTAFMDEEKFKVARELGVAEILLKGTDIDVLQQAVRRSLGHRAEPSVLASSSPSVTEHAPYDLSVALEELGILESEYYELIDIFVENRRPRLKELGRAVQDNDLKTVCALAHSLRGASANLRLYVLPDAAARLEEMAEDGDLSQAGPVVAEIEDAFQKLLAMWEAQKAPVDAQAPVDATVPMGEVVGRYQQIAEELQVALRRGNFEMVRDLADAMQAQAAAQQDAQIEALCVQIEEAAANMRLSAVRDGVRNLLSLVGP